MSGLRTDTSLAFLANGQGHQPAFLATEVIVATATTLAGSDQPGVPSRQEAFSCNGNNERRRTTR
jgi:hypothetical protein